jgi:hypothetical protein
MENRLIRDVHKMYLQKAIKSIRYAQDVHCEVSKIKVPGIHLFNSSRYSVGIEN